METVNQGNATEVNTPEEGTKDQQQSFTQDELNAIVGERLAREAKKYADYDELKAKAAKLDELEESAKSELQKATEKAEKLEAELNSLKKAEEIRAMRDEVATETGVPASLLTAETAEECQAQAKAILSFANADVYPSLKDGGEVQRPAKGSTKDQFAQWANTAFNS